MSDPRNSFDFTPEMILEDALRDIRSGKLDCNKMIILPIKADGDEFLVGAWYASGIRASEGAIACEIGKMLFLNALGYARLGGMEEVEE